jgi:hypothetical protein
MQSSERLQKNHVRKGLGPQLIAIHHATNIVYVVLQDKTPVEEYAPTHAPG